MPRSHETAGNDTPFLRRALAMARRYRGRTHPNPTVGAVIVKDGAIIAAGAHVRCGSEHAERAALGKAGDAARGADMYVTLEPCCHHGRTPPCTAAIIEAGIKRVVILNRDPNPISGSGADVLRNAGIEVEMRCDTPEALAAARLNAPFFKHTSEKLPFVTAKWALAADGVMCIPGKRIQLTGVAARADAHKLRARVDAVLVGIGTVLTDDPLLDTRLAGGKHSPAKVIIDSRLRTPPDAKCLAAGRTIIMHGSDAPAVNRKALQKKGAELIELPCSADGLDIKTAAARLAEMDLIHILLEAGPRLQSAFMDAGLVDEVIVYRAPCLIGPGDSPLAHTTAAPPKLKHLSTRRLDDDIKDVYAVNLLPGEQPVYRWEEKVLCSQG